MIYLVRRGDWNAQETDLHRREGKRILRIAADRLLRLVCRLRQIPHVAAAEVAIGGVTGWNGWVGLFEGSVSRPSRLAAAYNQALAIRKKVSRSRSLQAVFAQSKHSAPNCRHSFADVTGLLLSGAFVQCGISSLGSMQGRSATKKSPARAGLGRERPRGEWPGGN